MAIVVGGLAERDLSDSEKLKVVVAERKGFVKKALMHGAEIIPCIAFGEYSIPKNVSLTNDSSLYRIECEFYKLFKFKHMLYYGTSAIDKIKGLIQPDGPIIVALDDQNNRQFIFLNQIHSMVENNLVNSLQLIELMSVQPCLLNVIKEILVNIEKNNLKYSLESITELQQHAHQLLILILE